MSRVMCEQTSRVVSVHLALEWCPDIEQPRVTLHIYTDASGKKGLGGIFRRHLVSLRCPRRFSLRDIQFKEIYAVLQAIMRWGHLWDSHHIVFHVDSNTSGLGTCYATLSSLTTIIGRCIGVLRRGRSIPLMVVSLPSCATDLDRQVREV